MNHSPNPQFAHAEKQVLLSAYTARQLPGDHQVLADDVLQAALAGEQPLSRAQLAALKASPLTLCRLRHLEAQRLANAGQHTQWQHSQGELLAAAGTDPDFSLPSADGLWMLHALTTGHTTRLLLQLRRPADDEGQLSLRLEPDMEVAVLDGNGSTLMLGHLDADGELETPWNSPQDLRSHLAQYGGQWSVERV